MRFTLCGLAVVLAVSMSSQAGILPPHSFVQSKSIGEWSGDWWTWLFSIPNPNSPVADTTGQNANNGQHGPVFFVAGTMGGDAERTFTVPPGKYLLVPLVNSCFSQLTDGGDEQTLRAGATASIDTVDLLIGKLDGLTINNLFLYREVTPEPFEFTVVANNPYGVPAADSGIAVAEGYWLMFEPLTQGQTLDLVFGGGESVFGWSVSVTVHITAVLDQVTTGDVYVSATEGNDLTGDGSEAKPWQTITFAMSKIAGYAHEVTIHLAPDRYEERVDFLPNVRLVGADPENPEATVIAPVAAQLQTGGYVVVGEENTVMRDLTIELTLDAPPSVTLLLVNNVKMTVENVVFNGRDVPDSIGVSILNVNSSDSLITRSHVKRVSDAIRVVESGANFTKDLFEDIRFDAVFVRRPAKDNGDNATPVFGDETRAAETGVNEFRNVQGFFVRNFSGEQIKAELNDWGFDTEEEIATKMQGNVDFVPFLKSGLVPGSLACLVTDIESGEPILDASILLGSSGFSPVTQNIDGVYTFAVLCPGDYTLTVCAPSCATVSRQVSIAPGEIETVSVSLEFSGGEGEGEGEGEGGSGCLGGAMSSGDRRGPGLGSDAALFAVTVLLLVAIEGKRRVPGLAR